MVNIRNLGAIIGKAKQVIQDNPDKVRAGLDKVEQVVDSKTGGKYRDQISKGADALESALGVPKSQTVPGQVSPTDSDASAGATQSGAATTPPNESASSIPKPEPVSTEPIDKPGPLS